MLLSYWFSNEIGIPDQNSYYLLQMAHQGIFSRDMTQAGNEKPTINLTKVVTCASNLATHWIGY